MKSWWFCKRKQCHAEQGIAGVLIEKAPDLPQLHPKSGKFQPARSEVKQQAPATLAEP